MHSEFQIIDVVFQLTIFTLLAYQIISLSKKYLIPFLYKEVKDEQDSRENLIEKENILISSQHKIETKIRHQHLLFESLEKNVKTWQEMLELQAKHKENEFNQIKNSVEEKRTKQQINYVIACTSKDVLPYAINQAEAELTTKYLGNSGKHLFDNLVEKITVKKNSKDA